MLNKFFNNCQQIRHAVCYCLFTFTLTSCAVAEEFSTASDSKIKQGQMTDTRVFIEGEWRYINLEGGFCGIIGTDNKKYLPLNPPQNCQDLNGKAVAIKAQIRRDVNTIQMWGTPIEILQIDR